MNRFDAIGLYTFSLGVDLSAGAGYGLSVEGKMTVGFGEGTLDIPIQGESEAGVSASAALQSEFAIADSAAQLEGMGGEAGRTYALTPAGVGPSADAGTVFGDGYAAAYSTPICDPGRNCCEGGGCLLAITAAILCR